MKEKTLLEMTDEREITHDCAELLDAMDYGQVDLAITEP